MALTDLRYISDLLKNGFTISEIKDIIQNRQFVMSQKQDQTGNSISENDPSIPDQDPDHVQDPGQVTESDTEIMNDEKTDETEKEESTTGNRKQEREPVARQDQKVNPEGYNKNEYKQESYYDMLSRLF